MVQFNYLLWPGRGPVQGRVLLSKRRELASAPCSIFKIDNPLRIGRRNVDSGDLHRAWQCNCSLEYLFGTRTWPPACIAAFLYYS